MCGFLRYLSWKHHVWQLRSYSLNRDETSGEAFAVDSISFFQQFFPTQHTEIREGLAVAGLATGTTTTDLLSPGSPCSIHLDKSWIQVSTSPIFSMVSVCFWRMSFLTLAWTSWNQNGWMCRVGMWSCERSKTNKNQPINFSISNA